MHEPSHNPANQTQKAPTMKRYEYDRRGFTPVAPQTRRYAVNWDDFTDEQAMLADGYQLVSEIGPVKTYLRDGQGRPYLFVVIIRQPSQSYLFAIPTARDYETFMRQYAVVGVIIERYLSE